MKDVYSLANNPQYKLEVQCPTGGAAVWVLLTRHITDKVSEDLILNDGVEKICLCVTAGFCCSRMILHKTESLSLLLFIRRMARRSTTQVRAGKGSTMAQTAQVHLTIRVVLALPQRTPLPTSMVFVSTVHTT